MIMPAAEICATRGASHVETEFEPPYRMHYKEMQNLGCVEDGEFRLPTRSKLRLSSLSRHHKYLETAEMSSYSGSRRSP